MKTKRPRIFNRSSPLRNRRRDILFLKPDDDDEREMREIYAQAAAEERWKMRLREITREEAKREKERLQKSFEDSERLIFLFLLMEDNQVDTGYLQDRLDKIDELRSNTSCVVQLKKARAIAEELHEEMEGQSGADKARARIERRLTHIDARMEEIPSAPHLECAA